MRKYLLEDEWLIIEEGFDREDHKRSESLFSLGNGHMGMRANFEETYTGPSLRGTYLAGIYYPDKTRVGWWKNGYPEYFAKVLNAPNWIGMKFRFNEEELNLDTMKVSYFRRVLNMKEGILSREFIASWSDGKQIRVETERFLSMKRREIGAIRYYISPLNFSGTLEAELFIDGNVVNEDANYDEKFWEPVDQSGDGANCYLRSRTKKSAFDICMAMHSECLFLNGQKAISPELIVNQQYVSNRYQFDVKEGDQIRFTKIACVTTSRDYVPDQLLFNAGQILDHAVISGYENLKHEQITAWADKWKTSDIVIEGDISAQQGIRFNIFHLNQTYTGYDPLLNIGPKGFTGEKYGGSTYWDTEAYCLPFYLNTADKEVARNLLIYRYRHLGKAIQNAEKLGFTDGAALYPMVTINGEECHNEWEITFEEIHRNGAIAYAVYNYIRHTGDDYYLAEYGLEVLIGISRFWSQRFNFSDPKQLFVMLGVTGPNEYENNVNNNWYTNYIASWTLTYTLESIDFVRGKYPDDWNRIEQKSKFRMIPETSRWSTILNHVFLPADDNLGIFLQQEGYLDKEQLLASDLSPDERPINQHWSWDRILRSCFIKQADVLEGLYLFEDHFSPDIIRRNFDFYEPRTVHESSLSPCVHAILASKLGYIDTAYQLYLRTSRLDLDDYNHEVQEGCHITSMAGTWLAIVEGFGGMRVIDNQLHFNPLLPQGWTSLSFTVHFRGHLLVIIIDKRSVRVIDQGDSAMELFINNTGYQIKPGTELTVQL
ncbi:MAG: glycoside hydrolase family 65 protein [Porphyromonadaceae bacterium]|nr:MAG: glycoside hydrolase family 65 protein [Porphyromonadaceae bacterium]